MQLDNSEFEITKRRGLIVWVYSLKQLKNLKKFGLLHYVSRRMKYVVLYLNEETFEETEERIRKLPTGYRNEFCRKNRKQNSIKRRRFRNRRAKYRNPIS